MPFSVTSENFNVYAPGFVARFIESHAVMFQGNAGLKPKDGEITSRPWHWPINLKGQFFSGNDHRIYLLGNPIVWWSNLIFLNLFVIIFITRSIKRRRREAKSKISLFKGSPDNYGSIDRVSLTDSNALYIVKQLPTDKAHMETQISSALWLYVGWAIHYLPFWIMGRVLYFHHYFPALAFNSMLTGVMFYYTTCRLQRGTQICLLILLMFGLVYSFKLFSPLAYGMSGPSGKDSNSKMNGLKWLPTWEF